MKKHRLPILVLLFCFLFSSVPVYAANVIGKAVHTDIVCYINGLPIRSYNVKGQTAIVAEDLREYGFFATYNDEKRHLDVYSYEPDNPDKITAHYVPPKNKKPIGSFAANVYATDIVTTIEGEKVPAYNIGGETLIFIDELKRLGDVIWYPKERKVCFTYVPNWIHHINKENAKIESTKEPGFSITLNKNAAGTFDVSGKNIAYFGDPTLEGGREPNTSFSFDLYYEEYDQQTEDTKTHLLDPMVSNEWNKIDKEKVNFANAHTKVKVNGTPATLEKVFSVPGNGHLDFYFVINREMRKLEDIQSIEIVCQ